MGEEIKIGLSIPYMGVYPFYNQYLMGSILLYLNQQDALNQNEVQCIPEHTKNNYPNSVFETVNKPKFLFPPI